MRKLLTSHRFTNGARLAVYAVRQEPGVPKGDVFLVQFRSVTRGQFSTGGWFLRPDEAVLLIEKLAGALYRNVVGYTTQQPRAKRG